MPQGQHGGKIIIPQEQINAMIHDYKIYIDVDIILKKYNVKKSTFYYLLKKNGEKRRPDIPLQLVEMAVTDFINGMLEKDVIKKYNISDSIIRTYMRNNGIHYKNGHGRKYHFNEEYFKNIDTEHKAYWLGFLYADGSITTSDKTCKAPNRLAINLSSKDRCIIEKFLEDIDGTNIRIQDYMPNAKTYGNTMMSRVYVNSKKFCQYLIGHGCIPNKTFLLDMPIIQKELTRHFIRGYFDGDGCICGNANYVQFGITGYDKFLNQIKAIMIYACSLKTKEKLYYYKNKDPRVCYFRDGNSSDIIKIYHYLYNDATIFLERKYLKFKSLVQQRI